MKHSYDEIIDFWFNQTTAEQQFMKDEAFDKLIYDKYHDLIDVIVNDKGLWNDNPYGILAKIIVLDQFTRNMFRDTPKAFEYDDLALEFAQDLINKGWDKDFPKVERRFVYMPFMHSEDINIQNKSLELFSDLDYEDVLHYAQLHYDIIARFNRYPHRNEILNRQSTDEEIEFLKQPNSSF